MTYFNINEIIFLILPVNCDFNKIENNILRNGKYSVYINFDKKKYKKANVVLYMVDNAL